MSQTTKYRTRITRDDDRSPNGSSPSMTVLITTIVITTAVVTYCTNSYLQQPMITHLERLDQSLERVIKEVFEIKEQLNSLKQTGYQSIREEELLPYQSKYRPLPADFEMFAIGFVIIFFLVLFMMFKGDMARGN